MPNAELNELSKRELDILKLVATGAGNKEIAFKLFISTNTVKVHLRNIFTKIGVASRTEAAMYAVRNGLVQTTSNQVLAQEDAVLNSKVQTSGFLRNKNRFIQVIGLSGIFILALVALGIYFARGNTDSPNTIIAPTSTPRVQWHELPGLTIPRRGLAVASFESQIYAIGGESAQGISADVERYDPQSNIWVSLPSKPTPVTDIHAAVIGGLIYVPGGKLTSGKPTDITEIYDPRSNKWSSGIRLPKSLSAYALAVFEGRMYIFGGWDGINIVNNAYFFDPNNNSWTEIPPLPTARSLAGCVVVGSKIYVIGGWDGKQALTLNEVYQPDISNPDSQWTKSTALPSGRYGMGATNIADIIFIIGGTNSEDDLTTIALSQEESNWGQLVSPIQKGWSFLEAVTVGSRLFALGGSTKGGLSDQMWSYQAIFTITLPIIR